MRQSIIEVKVTEILHAVCELPESRLYLSSVLRRKRTVRFRPMPQKALLELRDEELMICDQFYKKLAHSPMSNIKCIQYLSLYVIHELFHFSQNIAGGAKVQSIKACSHDELLKFDLEADHISAYLISKTRSACLLEWDFVILNRALLECLYFFPITQNHDLLTQQRKTNRVISLALEQVLRRDDLLSENQHLVYLCHDNFWSLNCHGIFQSHLGSGVLVEDTRIQMISLVTPALSQEAFCDRIHQFADPLAKSILGQTVKYKSLCRAS